MMDRVVFTGVKNHYYIDPNYTGLTPVRNEIYTPESMSLEDGDYCYCLLEIPGFWWPCDLFRPVTDCGDAICEYIEDVHFKEFEYQEIFTQLCQ